MTGLLIVVAIGQLGVGIYVGWLIWGDGVAKTLGRTSHVTTRRPEHGGQRGG